MPSLGKADAATYRNKVDYFGSRKSDKLVRCYEKDELEVYRVELELHSPFLRNHQITTLEGLEALASAIYPRHIKFVSVDWTKLERYLIKAKGRPEQLTLSAARARAGSIHLALRYLRHHGVNNPHRFLVPMPLNRKLIAALRRWERKFALEADEER